MKERTSTLTAVTWQHLTKAIYSTILWFSHLINLLSWPIFHKFTVSLILDQAMYKVIWKRMKQNLIINQLRMNRPKESERVWKILQFIPCQRKYSGQKNQCDIRSVHDVGMMKTGWTWYRRILSGFSVFWLALFCMAWYKYFYFLNMPTLFFHAFPPQPLFTCIGCRF